MPLSGQVGPVARGFQGFGNRDAVLIQRAGIAVGGRIAALPVEAHPTDACLVRRESGQKRSSRGAASRSAVEVGEPHAAAGKPIQHRRTHLSPVAAYVAETHIVHKNHYDVWSVHGA